MTAQSSSKTIRLLVIEEAEIYRRLYERLPLKGPIDILGISEDTAEIRAAVATNLPDVLVLGTKKLDKRIVTELGAVREQHPDLGIVLLFVSFKDDDIAQLRNLTRKGNGGVGVFLKQSLDQIEQLLGIIVAVSHNQVVLDPALANFMFATKPEIPFLKELTPKETEILNFVAQGYTNSAIAQALFIEVKTVEHHLNSLYSKLKADSDFSNKHPRVTAARLYLQVTRELASN